MGTLKRVGDGLYQLLRVCLLMVLSVMTVVGFMQVIFRYVLKIPLPWAEELIRYLFIWMTLLGGGMAVRSKAHIATELLVSKMPPGPKLMTATIVSLGSLGFLGYMAVSGWQMTVMNMGQRTDALGIPMALPYLALPSGALVMIFFIIETMATSLQEWTQNSRRVGVQAGGE